MIMNAKKYKKDPLNQSVQVIVTINMIKIGKILRKEVNRETVDIEAINIPLESQDTKPQQGNKEVQLARTL